MTLTPYERLKKARLRVKRGLVSVQIGAGKEAVYRDVPKDKVEALIKWLEKACK